VRIVLLAAALAGLHAQTFEVASVKPAPPPEGPTRVGCTGGPGSKDPGRWSCVNMSLSNLLTMAFNIQPYQLTGPDWMNLTRFHIEAKLPEGATRDDFRKMLENLLGERFGLKYHRDQKEIGAYELVVAKGGPKLKAAGPPKEFSEQSAFAGGGPKLNAAGYPDLPPGASSMAIMNGKAAKRGSNEPMGTLARNLALQVGKPVTDATGLTGKYDYYLYWVGSSRGPSVESDETGPTIFSALQEQLGLKLEPKKTTVEMVIVDKLDKTPTEN
jgi:uncharacterized protein (TIGR03435 family)